MNTEILVITDRSGSMESIRDDVIGGFNTFVKEQRELPGEARMTYTQFDTAYEVIYSGRSIKEAPLLDAGTFEPRGGTALWDAIGRTLNEQGSRIANEKWAELVIVYIITDGQENSSVEYGLERIRTMTAHAEKNGWKFIYLAANQNAIKEAQNLGMKGATGMNFMSSGRNASMSTNTAYAASSNTVGNMRSSGGNVGLSDEWKKKLEDANKAV